MYAPVHQHFFVARMDFCVDGVKNSIVEYNAEAETEGPHNPTLNGFFFKETPLLSELAAVRDLSPETARYCCLFFSCRIHTFMQSKISAYLLSHVHTCRDEKHLLCNMPVQDLSLSFLLPSLF